MKIGILVTNTDHSPFAKARPSDGEKYNSLLQPLRPTWSFVPVDVQNGVFPESVDEYAGYVIGGSPASVNDPDSWIATLMEFIAAMDNAKKPTVGICFGHQAIAKALGGRVEKNKAGWGFGVATTAFNTIEPCMVPAKSNLDLYAIHNDQVMALPRQAEVLGGSAFCPIGSYKIGQHVMTTQYHPEIDQQFFSDIVEEYAPHFGETMTNIARAQSKLPTDNAQFAEWMLRFFELQR